MPRIFRFRTKPFAHQRKAALRALQLSAVNGGFLFYMDPRTGKTKAALDAIAMMALKGEVKRVVVVAPLGALSVWEEEIEDHYVGPASIGVFGSGSYNLGGSRDLAIPRVSFYLLNYEQYRNRSHNSKKYEYYVGQVIEEWHPDVIAFDESHRLKRAGGVTAQFAWRSVRRMRKRNSTHDLRPYVFELTGTPNPKGWIDLFAQLRVLDDRVFGTRKSDFEERHCEYGVGRDRYRIVRYKRVPELKRKVKERAFIISRAKAFPHSTEEFWQNVPVKLPPKARRMYDEMAEDLITEWEHGIIEAPNLGARRIRLQQITGGFTTDGRQIHSGKLEVTKSLLSDSLEQGERMVVYCRFIPEVHAVREIAEKVGYRAFEVWGKTRREDRDYARRRLRGSSDVCLVFQVATGSLAIDLSAAGEVLFYSLPDGWLEYWQAISRLHGPKQTRGSVRYRHLIAAGTLDRPQLRNLKRKADMHEALMGDIRNFLKGAI